MVSAWRNFKNIFPRPLFIIIFWPEMLKFHPYSILTGDTRVEFVIYNVLSFNFKFGIYFLPTQIQGASYAPVVHMYYLDTSRLQYYVITIMILIIMMMVWHAARLKNSFINYVEDQRKKGQYLISIFVFQIHMVLALSLH